MNNKYAKMIMDENELKKCKFFPQEFTKKVCNIIIPHPDYITSYFN